MKVINTYIVKDRTARYEDFAQIFECEGNVWVMQREYLQNEWVTGVTEVSEEYAKELINYTINSLK